MRRAVLVGVVGVVIGGCGETTADGGTTTATGGANGGSDAATGGGSGGDGQVSSGAGGVPSGGQGSESAGAGGADDCDEHLLWYTFAEWAASLGECGPSSELCNSAPPWGVVVFDSEGRATDVTGLEAWREEGWLQDIASDRWPCLADQTVEYCCLPEG